MAQTRGWVGRLSPRPEPGSHDGRGPDRLLAAAAAIVFAAGMALGAVAALRAGWLPIADEAFIEMRVRDVPGELPLLGVYSRFGWNHPGPIEFWLLAVPYRVLFSASAALLVGMLALHAAAALAAWRIAARLDRLTGLVTFVVLEVCIVAAPVHVTRSPWNPYVGLATSVLLVVAAWGVANRHRAAAVLLLPLASLLVQVHLVNAFLVLGATSGAVIGCLWGHRRSPSSRSSSSRSSSTGSRSTVTLPVDPAGIGPDPEADAEGEAGAEDAEGAAAPGATPVPWRALAIGAGLATAMWLAPLVAQVRGHDGRFSVLLTEGSGDGESAGLRQAVAAASEAFALRPSWADTESWVEGFASTDLTVPVWLVVALAGLFLAVRRRDRVVVRGLGIGLLSVALATVGVALLRDGFYSYLLVALRGSAAATTALGVGALLRPLPERAARNASLVLAAMALVLGVLVGARQLGGDNPGHRYGPAVEALTDAVLDSPVADEPLELLGAEFFAAAPGVALQLERAGVDVVVVGPGLEAAVGSHRVPAPSERRTQLKIAPLDAAEQAVADGWEVLGEYRVLTDAEARQVRELEVRRSELVERLRELQGSGGSDSAEATDLEWQVLEVVGRLESLVRDRIELFVAARPHQPGGG